MSTSLPIPRRFTPLAATLAMLATAPAALAVDASWVSTASGVQLWETAGNWSSNPLIPGGPGSSVQIQSNISTTTTVDLKATSRTVGSLSVGDAVGTSSFIIDGSEGGSLIFNQTGGASLTMSQGGNFMINADLEAQSNLTLDNQLTTHSLRISGDISGAGAITQNGPGYVYIASTSNTFSGGYTLASGTLGILGTGGLGSGTLKLQGGTFFNQATNIRTITNAVELNGAVEKIGTGEFVFSDFTLAGNSTLTTTTRLSITSAFGGSHTLTKKGADVLDLRATARTFSGTFVLDGGTVLIQNNTGLGTATLRFLDGEWATGATTRTFANDLELGGFVRLGSATLAGQTGGSVFTGDATLLGDSEIAVAASGGGTLSGNISGNHGLTKSGAHDLLLSGSSTYTGQTTVAAGRLVVDGDISASSGVHVAAGAVLAGRGTVSTLSGAGSVNPGASPGILTAEAVDGSGGLDFVFELTATQAGGISNPTFSNAAASGNDVLRLTGETPFTLALDGGNTLTFDLTALTLQMDDRIRGGFFVEGSDFLSQISGADIEVLGLG